LQESIERETEKSCKEVKIKATAAAVTRQSGMQKKVEK
jgi:hypothetical protein